MSYLVLARKYRPTNFTSIVGQPHIVQTLKNAIAIGRVHHAFLFCGARGVGKTTTARVLARALNCTASAGPTAEPCGTCAPCMEIAAGQSPDVLEIDGASNTGVDNVRELRETVRYLPQRGRFKIYIIDEVHMLTQAAFNALLKTLEEPPPHVKFIFATTEVQKIPITILSRCQRFDFRRVSLQTLTEQVRGIAEAEGIALSTAAATAIAREAQGSVRDALSLLDQVVSYAGQKPADADVVAALGVVERETVFALCDAVLAQDAPTLLRLVDEIDNRGHDLADAAGLLVEHLRDVTVAKSVPQPAEVLQERSPSELEGLVRQAAARSRAELHRLFTLAVALADDVSRSFYPRLALEMGLLRLLEVEPTANLNMLISRLDALATGAPPAGAPTGESAGGTAPRAPTPASQTPSAAKSESAAPQAPAAPSPAAPAEAVQPGPTKPAAWTEVIEAVRGKRPAFASVLEHGRVLRFDTEAVEVGFPAGTFYWDSAQDSDNRALLHEALNLALGGKIKLSLQAVTGELATESLAEAKERTARERLEEIREGALQHPAIKSATQILGGEVKKVVALLPDAPGNAEPAP